MVQRMAQVAGGEKHGNRMRGRVEGRRRPFLSAAALRLCLLRLLHGAASAPAVATVGRGAGRARCTYPSIWPVARGDNPTLADRLTGGIAFLAASAPSSAAPRLSPSAPPLPVRIAHQAASYHRTSHTPDLARLAATLTASPFADRRSLVRAFVHVQPCSRTPSSPDSCPSSIPLGQQQLQPQ